MDDDSALTASATGILHCLRVLAEEAAFLRLDSAVVAIQDAIDAVALESGADAFAPFSEGVEVTERIILH